MINVNENEYLKIKMIRSYIKDLSYENPQSINENNSINNDNSNIDVKMNVVYKPYNDNNFFSLILRYNFNCTSNHNKKTLFNLELDYFGFFEILKKDDFNQEVFTKIGIKLLFPSVKELVENISKNGGSLPISLKDMDFNLEKN